MRFSRARSLVPLFTAAVALAGCAGRQDPPAAADQYARRIPGSSPEGRPEPPAINLLPQDAAEFIRDYRRPCLLFYDRRADFREEFPGLAVNEDGTRKPETDPLKIRACLGKGRQVYLKVEY